MLVQRLFNIDVFLINDIDVLNHIGILRFHLFRLQHVIFLVLHVALFVHILRGLRRKIALVPDFYVDALFLALAAQPLLLVLLST